MNFDFPIILENYYPKHSDRDELDFSDKVVVDFELFDKTFHEEVKNFYVNIYNKQGGNKQWQVKLSLDIQV